MNIYIASDHGGVELKAALKEHLKEVVDLGVHSEESADYPDQAHALAGKVVEEGTMGILICRSGIGMSIVANKHQGVRAALCMDAKMAEMARRHNNANVLCLAADYITEEEAKEMADIFLNTPFDGDSPDGERHRRRVEKIEP